MTNIINVADYASTSFRVIRLKTLMNEIIREKQFYDTNDEWERSLKPGEFAKKYLQYTGQYIPQFELCLKTFNGKKAANFTEEKRNAIINLYEKQIIEEGESLKKFASDHIN